ncbi:MAG: NAD-dependent epimerase/dehydratase family protein [Dehalococcoidia bacterium]
MRALITGGAGFIGSHLAEELLQRGHEVIAFDDLSTGNRSNVDHLMKTSRFSLRQGSILDTQLLESVIGKADLVYHLAASVGVKNVLEHPLSALTTNVQGTENVLQLALQHGKKKVILASSSEVYGKSAQVPFRENDDLVLGPTSVSRWGYACAKALDEFLALAYHQEEGLPILVLRFFNIVGPRQVGRYGMVLPRFVAQARQGEPITVYGDGEQQRSFTYVKDAVRAVADIAEQPAAEGQVFNVGNNHHVSINCLAELVRDTLASRSEIVHIPYSEAYGPDFEDIRLRAADISKIQQHIDYQPNPDLAFVIKEINAGW